MLCSLLSTSAFSGDMYLNCASPDGEFWVSAYIDDGKAEVSFTDDSGRHEYTVSLAKEKLPDGYGKNIYTISESCLESSDSGAYFYEVSTDNYDETIHININISCYLMD